MRVFILVFVFVLQPTWAVELVDLPSFNGLLKFDKKSFPPLSPLKKPNTYAPGCRVYKPMAEALTKAHNTLKLQGIQLEIQECSPFSLKVEPIYTAINIQMNSKKVGEFRKAMRREGFKSSHPNWWDFSD